MQEVSWRNSDQRLRLMCASGSSKGSLRHNGVFVSLSQTLLACILVCADFTVTILQEYGKQYKFLQSKYSHFFRAEGLKDTPVGSVLPALLYRLRTWMFTKKITGSLMAVLPVLYSTAIFIWESWREKKSLRRNKTKNDRKALFSRGTRIVAPDSRLLQLEVLRRRTDPLLGIGDCILEIANLLASGSL